jgi:hypothetical protein
MAIPSVTTIAVIAVIVGSLSTGVAALAWWYSRQWDRRTQEKHDQ